MPNWKKVITSGSDAALNSLLVTNGVTITGSLNVTGSANINGQLSASSGHFATRAQIGELGTEQTSVKINGLTFNSNLKVSDLSNSNAAQTILHKHSTTVAPIVVGARSNSDTTSHGAVVNDMPTLSIYGAGWTSGTYSLNGQINIGTDDTGTISGTSSPGKIEFWTTPNGTIWPEMAMKIDSNKKLIVSGNLDALGTGIIGSTTSLSAYTIDDGVSSMMDYDQIDLWSAYTVTGEILWNEPINETILRGQLVTKTPGGWVLAENKTSQGIFSYMLGIALDNAAIGDRAPILLKGMVTTTYNIDQSSADSGTPVYMDGASSGGPGNMSSTPQTHPGFTVRVVGYTYINSSIQSSGNYVLRFDPSSTWVEL